MTRTPLRALILASMLLVPAALDAQRIPLPGTGRRGPARPSPLPPQAEPVARALAYRRLPLSVEAYPLISYVRSPELVGNGVVSSWTSFGSGTRADYRLHRNVSATLDLTSSFAGGPVDVHTLELGTRFRPDPSGGRASPFLDFRVGYIAAYNSLFGSIGYNVGAEPGPTARFSQGYGAVVGAGVEFDLSARFSLTTAASLMRNRMTTRDYLGSGLDEQTFGMTAVRYTIGIRYNPIRVIKVPGTDMR